jgi:hypothetical protein
MRDQMDEEMNKRIKESFNEFTGAWDIHIEQAMK